MSPKAQPTKTISDKAEKSKLKRYYTERKLQRKETIRNETNTLTLQETKLILKQITYFLWVNDLFYLGRYKQPADIKTCFILPVIK